MSKSRVASAHQVIWVPVVVTAGVFIGCWWWLRGYTVTRGPARGWRRWAGIAARGAVLVAAFGVANLPGPVRWWGLAALVLCGAWGSLAFLRLLREVRQNGSEPTRTGVAPTPQANSVLADQMRRLVLSRRAAGGGVRRSG